MDDDLRILVLGDEESPEDLIDYELSKSNLRFMAIRATTLDSFLKALHDYSPNLILLTAGCAEISALTALALAQEICPGAPCFLVDPTAHQEKAAGVQANQIGTAAFRLQGMEPVITAFLDAIGISALLRGEPEAVPRAKDALRPLMQGTGVIMAFLSTEGHILEFNRGAERLTGWRRLEILGKDGLELFFPEANRTSAAIYLEMVKSETAPESIDLPLQGRNGSTSAYRWHCNLVCDRQGLPAGIMLVGQPLAESKLWESQPRGRLARCCPSPTVAQGRGLLTRRTGTC
jgi:PAS domain S-box-containing protein